MIHHISIRDFAIIENTEADFHPGLNILTGETGSGKSIVIEAVSLALGARADTAFVRSGKEKAVVQLAADLDGEEIIITREVSSAGKNLCRLNGEIVTLGQLSSYCKKLADIHGQYDHQSLLNPDYHINLIDLYGQEQIQPLKDALASSYKNYKNSKMRLSQLIANAAENERKKDFALFEVSEIRNANLQTGESSLLEERISLMENSEKIYKSLAEAYAVSMEESPSATDSLRRISSLLSQISSFSSEFSALSSEFDDIYYRLEDLCRSIRNYRDGIVFSQEELDEALSRLEVIDRLKRKYGGSEEAVITYADEMEKKLWDIENLQRESNRLEQEIMVAEKELKSLSMDLSSLRRKAALELKEKISLQLEELNFPNSKLDIRFETLPAFTENGVDSMEFMISTNPGEPLKPLAKIASGGEMSRIMLAFKNIIADYDNIHTMIFDEIDAGISGVTASVVGHKLKEISKNHQIICITHLPQIAACGGHNYRIHKETDGSSTKTTLLPLNKEEKILEIARLLGGANVTETTLKSAEELVNISQ